MCRALNRDRQRVRTAGSRYGKPCRLNWGRSFRNANHGSSECRQWRVIPGREARDCRQWRVSMSWWLAEVSVTRTAISAVVGERIAL